MSADSDKNNATDSEQKPPVDQAAEHIDPICKMKVNPARAAASCEFEGQMYYFCNPRCKQSFEANPRKYLQSSTPESRQAVAVKSKSTSTLNQESNQNELKSFYLPESAFEYTCPMDPEVRQSTPGSCPICGMELEAAIKLDAETTGTDELTRLKNRLILSAVLTAALLAISMPPMFGAPSMLPHHLLPVVELVLASPVVLYCGAPIFGKALDAGKSRRMNMFSLIAFGVAISYAVSLLYMFLPNSALPAGVERHGMMYFESAASIITLVLLGQVLELKARKASGQSLEDLFKLAPAMARREESPGKSLDVPVYEVKKGDCLRVLPGDKVPVDGTIVEGSTYLDESLLSGNSLPVSKRSGDRVFAGTINGDGQILIVADSLGRNTVFAQIAELLASAQRSRSPMQDLADKISGVFIPAVIAIALVTFIGWFWLGGPTALPHAIQDAVSVLVVACPCALGLATPLAVSASVARAGKFGLMVKDARALEMLARASDFLVDKTGTVTQGKFSIFKIVLRQGFSEDEALRIAASVEQASKHPLAIAVCEEARQRGLELMQPEDFQALPGYGLKSVIAGRPVLLGSLKFMQDQGQKSDGVDAVEGTTIFLGVDGVVSAVFLLEDSLKPEAKAFLSLLKELNVRPKIVTGDNESTAIELVRNLQIDRADLNFGLLPKQKVELVRVLQSEGKVVAMMGDGVNDAAALAAADAGIAMSGGSDVAIHSAALTIPHSDLLTAIKGIKLGRLMVATMKENLILAFIYNAAALLLASGIFYKSLGIELNPAVAAAAMSLSSISVILNSSKIGKIAI